MNTLEQLNNWNELSNDEKRELTRLKELDLGDCNITNIPESVKQLKILDYLYLGFNQLKSVPEWIGQLKELKTLSFYNNILESLPESIGNLTGLIRLDIDFNKLNILPESIIKLKNTQIFTNNQGFKTLDKTQQEVPNYLLVNPSCVLKIDRYTNLDDIPYKIKTLSEVINEISIDTYLDACIENEWTIKPEAGVHAYMIITGQDFNIENPANLEIEYYEAIIKAYQKTKNEQLKKLYQTTSTTGRKYLDLKENKELNHEIPIKHKKLEILL